MVRKFCEDMPVSFEAVPALGDMRTGQTTEIHQYNSIASPAADDLRPTGQGGEAT